MAGLMLIRPAGPAEWRWVTSASEPGAVERGAPSEAGRAAPGRRVILLVPGADVSLMVAEIPARNRRTAVAAIPWALEDRLIDEVETLHFAVGARTSDDRWPVAVVSRSVVDGLLAECAEIGLEPQALLPEPLALPMPRDDTWVVLEEAERLTVRIDGDNGFACEPAMMPAVLNAIDPPGELVRYRTPDAPTDPWPEPFDAVIGRSDHIDCPEPLTVLSEAWSPRINLLQGPYATGSRYMRHLRQWKLPAGLAAGIVALALVHATIEHFNRIERETQLRTQMETIYKETFPDAQRVVDPRAQMEGRIETLKGRGDGAGFVEAIERLAQPLANHEDLRLMELEWREGTLDLALRTSGLELLDRVQKELQQTGFSTELRDVQRNENRVTGRLRLQATAK